MARYKIKKEKGGPEYICCPNYYRVEMDFIAPDGEMRLDRLLTVLEMAFNAGYDSAMGEVRDLIKKGTGLGV